MTSGINNYGFPGLIVEDKGVLLKGVKCKIENGTHGFYVILMQLNK
jgi:hypothetical protein